MNDNLAFEAFYPHPPEKVWQALTDPSAMADWLMTGTFEPRVGFRYELSSKTLRVTGEVLESTQPSWLSYTWDDGEAGSPSVVTWTLEPKDDGTLLRLEHAAIEEPVVLIEARMNWPQALSRLMRQPVPIVYDDLEENEPLLARAGFRQEPVPQTTGRVSCR